MFLLFGVGKLRVFRVGEDFGEEFFGKVVSHGEIHVQVVAAVFWGSSGDLIVEIGNESEHLLHEGEDVTGIVIAGQKEVEAGAAAHGTEVEDLFFPVWVVAQESCGKMLDGVDFGRVHDWLVVGTCHADVEGGDRSSSGKIFAGNVDSRN